MTTPNWISQEKLVAVLERHLDPTASIRQNVRLPVLVSQSGWTAQCDVVIVQGQPPRQTVSIVEVQKRGRKPDINEFRGWLEKMREVGAQHLICVSQEGFPQSIEEKADDVGPTVRLLTLSEEDSWPPLLLATTCSTTLVEVRYDQLVGLRMEYVHLVRESPQQQNLPNPPLCQYE